MQYPYGMDIIRIKISPIQKETAVKKLRYGNTNTFFIPGTAGGLLIDTDYAGTLHGFFRAIKAAGIGTDDISHLIVTHYHPDHMGIAGELQKLGIILVILDVQLEYVHFSDEIFARERHPGYVPVDESTAKVITFTETRAFLRTLGIDGEIVHTPSHSKDSVSVVLNDGDCFVGDLERMEYLGPYGDNAPLKEDWDTILAHRPVTVYYSHSPEYVFTGDDRSRAQ